MTVVPAPPPLLVTSTFSIAAGTAGRLAALGVLTYATWRFLQFQLARLDDPRLRAQLLYFVPRVMAVPVLFIALAAARIDVSAMAATMATVGFTGAVVFTPLGQNLVAGAMVRIDDVYRTGEVVSVDGICGRVVYRSMLRTELALPDGSNAYVPNSAFQDERVLNHSRAGGWRMRVEVPIDRPDDRERARAIMELVVNSARWREAAEEPFVALDRVGGDALFFHVHVWITDRTAEPRLRSHLLEELIDALEACGVSVGQTTNVAMRGLDETLVTLGNTSEPRWL